MNTQSIPEHNDDVMIASSSCLSKENDVVDLVKSTATPRLAMLGKTSPMNVPSNLTGKNGNEQKKRRKKRKKKWTKPEGKPKRPLSAYNIFFAKERILMLGKDVPTAEQEALKKKVHCKTHGKISFAVMARTIGAKWKALGSNEKKVYENKAREEKARYLSELSSWKEAQKNGGSTGGRDISKMVDGDTSIVANRQCQIDLGLGVSHAKSGIVTMSAQTIGMTDLRVESSAVESITPHSQGNSCPNSNLVRLILEEENRNRYLSLLRLQSQANQSRYPQIDQANFPLNAVPRHVSTSVDTIPGSQQLQSFNIDDLFADRTLLRNLQGHQNPSLQEYNSRYFQALEEYATILQLEDQHNRMIGSFNGRNPGS